MASRKKDNLLEDDLTSNKSKIKTILNSKIELKAKSKKQKELLNLIKEKEIIIIAGPAGSGKTFLSLGKSLQLLSDDKSPFERIYLLKSVKTLRDEELGFLKGEIDDKLKPSYMSYMMNVEKLINLSQINKLYETNAVISLPIGYMRGLSIDNSIIILDEVQNISLENLRTIMTRIGENSKLIIMGDLRQIDLKDKRKSSLKTAFELFSDMEEIGVFEFSDEDIVRNPLIQKIEKKFEEFYINTNNYNQDKKNKKCLILS